MALLPTAKFAANLLDAGGEVFNVRHPSYGAVGDAVADDGVAWNSARAAVNAAGGVVLVPQGAYLLTTAFTFAAATNVLLWLLPGVVLTGSALPTPSGTNAIFDQRSGIAQFGPALSDDFGARLRVRETTTSASGTVESVRFELQSVTATTGNLYALEGVARIANTSGTVTSGHGLKGIARMDGVSGTVTNLRGVHGQALQAASTTVTNLIALLATVTQDGTTTNAIGLDVENVSGATNNFAIRTGTGLVSVGGSTNANMTTGVIVDQGGSDDQILACKSSDVTTGLTTATNTILGDVEADDFLVIRKGIEGVDHGGVVFGCLADNGASASRPLIFDCYGGDVDSDKGATTAAALVEFQVSGHDGANALANLGANANVLGVRGRVGGANRMLFMVDEDGDLYADGTTGTGATVGLMDPYDDAHLARALDLAVDRKGLIRSTWDDHLKYNEATLVECGVLGDTVENGGMVCITQLQRLHNGAIWQAYVDRQEMKAEWQQDHEALHHQNQMLVERIESLEKKLLQS